jgi:hypothetical protein
MRLSGPKSLASVLLSAVCLLSAATPALSQATPANSIQNFRLVTSASGWLLAGGRLFWTSSAGSQWNEITPPAPAGASIAGATFSADGRGYAVQAAPDGTSLAIAQTSDNGQHWTSAALANPFSDADPFGGKAYITFADHQNGWLTLTLQSSSAFRLGLLFRTTDGGLTWTQLPNPPIGAALTFIDATHGFTGPGPGGDELYATSDAGQTWNAVSLPAAAASLASTPSTIALPTFTDATHGVLLRTYSTGPSSTQVVYRTSDAGLTWTSTSAPSATSLIAIAADGTLTSAIAPTHPQSDLATSTATTLLPTRSSFASASSGWVLFEGGSCSTSQATCTQTSELMGTLDGGNTFFALGQPSGLSLQSTNSFSIPSSASTAIPFLAPAQAQPASSYPVTGVMGFDACSLPTVSQMQTWYTSSPYRVIGAYIGGDEFACSSGLSNFNTSWTSTILGLGFEIMPFWVGPQAPGNGSKFSNLMSTNTTTAYSQGVTEADSAIAAMNARGIGQGSPIIYDIEAYSYTVAADVAGTQAFIEGWDTELHAQGYIAGIYSSHPEFDSWIPPDVSPAIDTIAFAYFFSTGVACGTQCQTVYPTQTGSFDLSPNYWTNHHRDRQTSSSFNSTYGGVTINIDEDWTDAAMVVATPNTLTVSKSGSGAGTVVSTQISNSIDTTIDTAISCATGCSTTSSTFAATDTLTLTATPAANSTFTGWTGCTTTSGSTCTILVASSTTVTANFVANDTLTVTRSGTGIGTVTSADGAIFCGTACSASYTASTVVTLTATPTAGSVFTSWTGCTTTNGSTCTITMAAAESVVATFTLNNTLTVTKSGTGSGTVASSDNTINCGPTCSASYAPSTVITLTATPTTGSTFTSWTGCTSTTGATCSITMAAAESVVATFTLNNTLTVTKSGTGTGTVASSDNTINCGPTCSASYAPSTIITLTATPTTGSTFTSWTGCTSTTGSTCTVTMGAAESVVATFTLNGTLTVTKSGTGTGTVASSDNTINCGPTCSASYAPSTVITLTATPTTGSTFTSWTGCTTTTGATCTITMGAAESVVATFTLNGTLTVTKSGTGTGTVTSSDNTINCGTTCSASYAPSTVITLTATPTTGSSFTSWTGCTTTTGATCTITMAAAESVVANFSLNNTLTVTKTGTGSGTVASSDNTINCGTTCSASYAASTVVTLTATPTTGSTFTSWTGCTTTSGSTCTVTMAGAESVTATFTVNVVNYTLSVTKSGTGSGTVTSSDSSINCGTTCTASYAASTVVTLTAAPSSGSVFTSWTGCTSTNGSTCTVTMAAAESVTATFSPTPTFSSSLSLSALTITAGQSATDSLTITPQTGYTGAFTSFSCSGLPTSATCSFSPTTLTALGDGAHLTTTLTIATTTTALLAPPPTGAHTTTIVLASLFFPSLLLPFAMRRRKSRPSALRIDRLLLFIAACSALGLSQLLTGCGGGGSAANTGPIFSGAIQVNFTSASGTTQIPVELTINR